MASSIKPDVHTTVMTSKASAPGRLDVMGGISDYSGALVLQMPLLQTTEAEVETNSTGLLRIESRHQDQFLGQFEMPIQDLWEVRSGGEPFRQRFRGHQNGHWAVYPAACLAVLLHEKNLSPPEGLSILIQSTVPLGKGVSSSAAIEVSTLRALAGLFNASFAGTELAIMAQKAENHYVGAPCGLMDQLASGFGVQGSLLPILCQPDVLFPVLQIPEGLGFFGLDSGVKHEVVGASYSEVRTATSMGFAILAIKAGCSLRDLTNARAKGTKTGLPFGGYLANIPLSVFLKDLIQHLPESMTGEEFLHTYGQTADPYAAVFPDVVYPIRTCTRHPVEENFRTQQFRLLLQAYPFAPADQQETMLHTMGELMFLSHASYSLCGLGHARTDELVEMARKKKTKGVYGAKITGGGSGGTVCVLSKGEEGAQTVKEMHSAYEQKYGKKLLLIDPNPSSGGKV